MPITQETHSKILQLLTGFMESTGRTPAVISAETNLTSDLGLKSDEGVDFTLDLCDAFNVELPLDFNPFVHESGQKGRTFGEMVAQVARFVPVEKVAL